MFIPGAFIFLLAYYYFVLRKYNTLGFRLFSLCFFVSVAMLYWWWGDWRELKLVEREGNRHSDIRNLMLAVSKFMVVFSTKHYEAAQKHTPDVVANKAPGTSVAEKSGDFLSGIKDGRRQHLNKLIEIFGQS